MAIFIYTPVVATHKICDRFMFVGKIRLCEKRVYICGLKCFTVVGRFTFVCGFTFVGKKGFTFVVKFYVYGCFLFVGVTHPIIRDTMILYATPKTRPL